MFLKTNQNKFLVSIILAALVAFTLPEVLSKVRKNTFKAELEYEGSKESSNNTYKIIQKLTNHKFQPEDLAISLNNEIYSKSKNNQCDSFINNFSKPEIILTSSDGKLIVNIYGKSSKKIKKCINFIDEFVNRYEKKEKKLYIDLLNVNNFLILDNQNTLKEKKIRQTFEFFKKSLEDLGIDVKILSDDNTKILISSMLLNNLIQQFDKIEATGKIKTSEVNELVLIRKKSEKIQYFKPVKRPIFFISLFIVSFSTLLILFQINRIKKYIRKNVNLKFFKNLD